MGSFDGAEVFELVGLFLFHKMKHLFGCNCVGLYRDDGLAVRNNISGPKTDRTQKQLIRLFQEYDMKISMELNLTQTDFLDATLNLNTGKFWPYRKPNDNPLYINKNSNHPPLIKKQIPSIVNGRHTQLSSSENEFDRSAPMYNKALHESGYEIYLKYRKEAKTTKAVSNRRRRNIVWFNPPYSDNVETNIDHEFLNLITKHFPKYHRLHKICNKNNIKISYSCMPNMSAVILRHNKKLLSALPKTDGPPTADPKCNCRIKTACSLDGKCKQKSIVYKAEISSNNTTKLYYGSCSTDFKARFSYHKHSFTHRNKRNATELSKEV